MVGGFGVDVNSKEVDVNSKEVDVNSKECFCHLTHNTWHKI